MPQMFDIRKTGSDKRDNRREKLYRAERKLCDTPLEGQRFESVDQMQKYIDNLIAQKWFKKTWPNVIDRVTIHCGAGNRRATCSHTSGFLRRPVIKMPIWARSELILLHELAHALTPNRCAAHGWEFAKAYLRLVKNRLGSEAEKALKKSFREHKVKFSPKKKRELTEEQRQILRERMTKARAAKNEKQEEQPNV